MDASAAPVTPDLTRTRWVRPFQEGSREQRELLGGKGANVAEMMRVLGADRVPAGFTVTTEACVATMRDGAWPDGLAEQLARALGDLEAQAGRRLGDPDDPLLVSVRSGARESMPGMLDTVLNLGLNARSVEGLAARTGDARFAWDSFRRFVQMYGNVVDGVAGERFETAIAALKADRHVQLDTELDEVALRELTATFQTFYAFPEDPQEQLAGAIQAVFDSWTGERAVAYRRLNRIPDAWGTAVSVQQMVFGNRGPSSGSGVAFSRDEITGAPEPSGDFLPEAQGEDVVSGVRTPRDLAELATWQPAVQAELLEILRTLEAHYGDMQDTEFTVEEGRLYMLQTRSAKRPAQAAVRFAVDAVAEGLLTRGQALLTLDPATLDALLHPTFGSRDYEVLARGVAASPGAATGEVVLTARGAVDAAAEGRDVVLVRPFTEADDVAGFHAARGILTSEGGKASHAALVARGMGRPAVTGAAEVEVDLEAGEVRLGGRTLREGDHIAINGTTGDVTCDEVALVEPEWSPEFQTVLGWADELRHLGVRANADTPDDARAALRFGAEGIGLCRTEHMFLGDRQPLMAEVILAADDGGRAQAIARLAPLQEADFTEILRAMDGRPVCVRLLDPPLHEFLPAASSFPEGSRERARVESLQEANPMLGTRGVRLGILMPALYEMQVRALLRAAAACRAAGVQVDLEVMVPLVDYERELEITRALIERVAGETQAGDIAIGTMIELPRACFVADHIAAHADFFSFGTNDLTQTALGFSRDDIEGRILGRYIDVGILDRSPFETIDGPGVGQMLRMGAWLGRKTDPSLKLGVCGEHGGDPDSIDFFEHSGIDYVSCSPYRVPVARVAAAQAAIRRQVAGAPS